MKRKWEKLVDAGTNPYAHPYKGIKIDYWKYLIDEVWLDPANKRRYDAGKNNRSKLPYNHTSGSRSFPAAMSIAEQMTRVRDESIEAGTPMRQEDISRVVLGKKKGYLRGFGVGPKPSSCDSGFSAASQARDEQLKRLTSELEILRAEQQSNREEQQKKEEEQQMKEAENTRQRDEMQRQYCISHESGLIWSNSGGLHQICLDACGGVLQINSAGVLQHLCWSAPDL
ncbi:hypothetical protein ACSBR2_030018 [Camellia fascicularis]